VTIFAIDSVKTNLDGVEAAHYASVLNLDVRRGVRESALVLGARALTARELSAHIKGQPVRVLRDSRGWADEEGVEDERADKGHRAGHRRECYILSISDDKIIETGRRSVKRSSVLPID